MLIYANGWIVVKYFFDIYYFQLLLSRWKLQKFDVQSQFSTSETYQIFLKLIFLLEFVISTITFINVLFDLSQNLRSLFTKILP